MRNFNYQFQDSNIQEILMNHPQTTRERMKLAIKLTIADLDYLEYGIEETHDILFDSFKQMSVLSNQRLEMAADCIADVSINHLSRKTSSHHSRRSYRGLNALFFYDERETARVIFVLMLYMALTLPEVNDEVAEYLDRQFSGLIDKDNYDCEVYAIAKSICEMMN